MKWFINKENKIPLYLQLKDLVKYHISTGAIIYKQQLPTVHGLAKELGVNFDTVRKAYKELEREGLISTERGLGTFANGTAAARVSPPATAGSGAAVMQLVQRGVRELLQSGRTADDIRHLVDDILREAVPSAENKLVLFAECNSLQARQISEVLREHLQLKVKAVLLKDLKEEADAISASGTKLEAVITTGFHINEVRNTVSDPSVLTDFVIANMSPETRRKLDVYVKASRFGFVCRDLESTYYKDILQTEMNIRSEVPCCTMADKSKLAKMLRSVDVVLATPSVFESLLKLAPKRVRVFNVQDRVDPLSLKMLKDRMAHVSESHAM
jgi:DNA-binding transcriptional regulator YhcF (GntR family)